MTRSRIIETVYDSVGSLILRKTDGKKVTVPLSSGGGATIDGSVFIAWTNSASPISPQGGVFDNLNPLLDEVNTPASWATVNSQTKEIVLSEGLYSFRAEIEVGSSQSFFINSQLQIQLGINPKFKPSVQIRVSNSQILELPSAVLAVPTGQSQSVVLGFAPGGNPIPDVTYAELFIQKLL